MKFIKAGIMKTQLNRTWFAGGIVALSLVVGSATAHATGFTLGDAANYAVIFQGGGGNSLQINAGPAIVSGRAVNGNVGIAGTGTIGPSGGGGVTLINGNLDFAGTPNSFNHSYVSGTVSGGQTIVQNAMNYLGTLSTTLGAEAGTSISLNSGTTINASAGTIDGSGNSVFKVNSMNLPNGTVTINGDGTHNVVINFATVADFHANQIVLTGGLTTDQVLWNFYGGNSTSLSGGPSLNINSGGGSPSHTDFILYGTFLDPYGDINVSDSQIIGHVYGGDTQNFQLVSGGYVSSPPNVPDGGTTLVLLSLALGCLGLIKQKVIA
jgi:hypothetical protein